MNYSYKSFKHHVLIAFGLFFIFNFSSLNAQSFYSTDRCIEILKNEMVVLEKKIQNDKQVAQPDMNSALFTYYGALVEYWSGKNTSGGSTSFGSEISYAVNYYLFILYTDAPDKVDGFIPLTQSQAEIVKNETLEKLSH